MRPAGRADTESLYFTYPYFSPPTQRDALSTKTKVAIVGAGPVGMTAALTLANQGVRCVLLDNKSTFNDGSRAICVSRSSFYILDKLGALPPFLDKALGWTTGRSFYRGQQFLEFDMPDSPTERFRPMYNLQQQYIEQYLWDAVAANDLIETRWQSNVLGLSDDENGLALHIKDPLGQYDLPADWVLAADGARSAVRAARGLRLKGQNYEGRYVIADIRMQHDYPTIRRALFDPACRPGGTVLVHRQPDNIWRIDYQLRSDEDSTAATQESEVRRNIAGVLRDIGHDGPYDLEWWSVYSANTLALDDYRDGRVFFIGDSAHIVPIFGVRGLNNGLSDAQNIGWKLGYVLNAQADPAILDSYTPERRGATLDVFANATKSTRFMTPPSHGWRVLRDAALSLAPDNPFAAALANPRQMTPYTYADSPLTTPDRDEFDAGPPPGALSFDPLMENGRHLSQDLDGYCLLVFGDVPRDPIPDLHIIRLPLDSAVATAFGAQSGTTYLIRPDLHVAARWCVFNRAAITAALPAKQEHS